MLRQLRSMAIQRGLDALGFVYKTRLKQYPELADLLDQMEASRSAASSAADSIALYEIVLDRKPHAILELGAGKSSAVIALAAKQAGLSPTLFAIEESRDWLNHHLEIIPRSLHPLIQLEQRDTAAKTTHGQLAAYYKDLPVLPYEMVHVDGPDHLAVGAAISSDVVDMLPHLGERCVVIFDGREASARFSKPHLEAAGFKCSRHPYTMSYIFTRG